MAIHIAGLKTLPEIRAGDSLAQLIAEAAQREGHSLTEDTVLVIAQKVVSKAERALVDLCTIHPSPLAEAWARQCSRDARFVEVILQQSRRIVKMDRGVLIAETHHGLVAANAGVDQSNVPAKDMVTVLPKDPDGSARRIWSELGCGAVIISDTFGRPWREGLVNVAIGVAGIEPLEDYRGLPDRYGRLLHGTVIALADELASAAGLVMRKTMGVPVALITGVEFKHSEGTARQLIRSPERDLFR